VDMLGLSKASMAVPLTVTVVKPPSGPLAFLAKYRAAITFGSITLAGLVLFFILIGGRFRLLSIRAAQAARRAEADPLTQSVAVGVHDPVANPLADRKKKRSALSKKAIPESKSRKDAAASFIRVNADGQVIPVAPLPITEKETVFGTDPVQCTQIMDDPSISSVHARLRQTDDGGFLLQDNNSIAGTWVNYEPIPREGYRLGHGDMVHFGQLIYRFILTVPPVVENPKITVQLIEE
jgi:hypothetical protein